MKKRTCHKFTFNTPGVKWANRNFLKGINEELSPLKSKFPNDPSDGGYIAIHLHWEKLQFVHLTPGGI